MCVYGALQIYETQECVSVQQFCFVVHLLCSHPLLSSQLLTLLSELRLLCVLMCARPGSLQPKSLPAWHPFCLSEGIWMALAASQGHVSLSKRCLCPSLYHFISTPPPALACWGSPWYAWHAWFDMSVFSKCIRPFWAMLKLSEQAFFLAVF